MEEITIKSLQRHPLDVLSWVIICHPPDNPSFGLLPSPLLAFGQSENPWVAADTWFLPKVQALLLAGSHHTPRRTWLITTVTSETQQAQTASDKHLNRGQECFPFWGENMWSVMWVGGLEGNKSKHQFPPSIILGHFSRNQVWYPHRLSCLLEPGGGHGPNEKRPSVTNGQFQSECQASLTLRTLGQFPTLQPRMF